MKARVNSLSLTSDRPGYGSVGLTILADTDGTSATFTVTTKVTLVEAMAHAGFIGSTVELSYGLNHNGLQVVIR